MNSARTKSFIGHVPMPPPRSLPGMDRALTRIATRLVRHARPLLRANNAFLLTMTTNTQDEQAPLWTGFWDTRGALTPLPPAPRSGAAQRHFAALETAGVLLLSDLICRWPANAIPPAVGIFTDGGGVAFSSDYPSPLSSNWLAHHQAGLCPTTTLLPFRPNGAWARLIAPTMEPLIH